MSEKVKITLGQVEKHATLSDCGLYRYTLSRIWNERLYGVLWIMLNPSVADASIDDPTIRRCAGYAKEWGCGGITVVNLFALRATSPSLLFSAADPVGPSNDRYIGEELSRHSRRGDFIVCAWGANAGHPKLVNRCETVLRYLPLGDLDCLALTKGGHPKHPLYCKGSLGPVKYELNTK